MTAALRLELLGDLQIRSTAGVLVIISAKKAQALLTYLSVKPAQRVSREKIATLLWSSTGPDQARQSLRQTLSTLRKELTAILGDAHALVDECVGVAEDRRQLLAQHRQRLAKTLPGLIRAGAAPKQRGDLLARHTLGRFHRQVGEEGLRFFRGDDHEHAGGGADLQVAQQLETQCSGHRGELSHSCGRGLN